MFYYYSIIGENTLKHCNQIYYYFGKQYLSIQLD